MTTEAEASAEYRSGMERSAEAVRNAVRRHTLEDPAELARALLLCAPYVRYPKIGDEELEHRLRLDYLAGLEYGGYHGFGYDRIQDECEWIETFYFEEIAAEASAKP